MGVEVKGPGDCPFEPSGRCPERPEHYQSSCGCLKRYNYTGSVIFNLLG